MPSKTPDIRNYQFLLLIFFTTLLWGCAWGVGLSQQEQNRLAGKTVVVTGASSGFGKGVAYKLAKMHAKVVIAARSKDVLDAMAAEIVAAGGEAIAVPADVSNPQDIQRLSASAIERFGHIDIWINNAGIGAFGLFDEIPINDHARIIDVNLKGVIYGSHFALQQFKAQGYGTLVNVGSIDSEIPVAYHSSYVATKAAVLSLGRTLNEELRLSGHTDIAVATLLPWGSNTPFFKHAANYSGHELHLKTLDDPATVVDAMIWLALHPQEELAVGWKAKASYTLHRFFPDIVERVAANEFHEMLIEAPPTPQATSGNLYRPLHDEDTANDKAR